MTAYFRGPGGPKLFNPWIWVLALVAFVVLACMMPSIAQPSPAPVIRYALSMGPDYELVSRKAFINTVKARHCPVTVSYYDARGFKTLDPKRATLIQRRCEL